MKILTLLVPVILLLAGCTESGEPATEADPPVDTDPNNDTAQWQTFDANFSLILYKQPPLVIGLPVVRENCVFVNFGEFGRDPFQVRNGSVTMTWTPVQPLAENLQLIVVRADDRHLERFNGVSPVEGNFSTEGKWIKLRYSFSVETALDEFPVHQEVDLHIRFEYQAAVDEPRVGIGACGAGIV